MGFFFVMVFVVVVGFLRLFSFVFLNQHLQTFKPNLTCTEVSNLPQTSAGTLIRAQCVLPVPLPMPNARQEASVKF